jgi:antitoxin VapB
VNEPWFSRVQRLTHHSWLSIGRVFLDKTICIYDSVDMITAKLFKHGGSQAVRLPKAFRFDGSEVFLEKRGEEVVLRPKRETEFRTLGDVARYMASLGGDFPDRDQPKADQKRDLSW